MSNLEPDSNVIDMRARIKSWKPADPEQLLHCLNDLIPELNQFPSAEQTRRFQGTPLRPQQAGWLFEHWVCEAFRLAGGETILVEESVRVLSLSSEKVQEELDGLAILGWQGFLIQCKSRRPADAVRPDRPATPPSRAQTSWNARTLLFSRLLRFGRGTCA